MKNLSSPHPHIEHAVVIHASDKRSTQASAPSCPSAISASTSFENLLNSPVGKCYTEEMRRVSKKFLLPHVKRVNRFVATRVSGSTGAEAVSGKNGRVQGARWMKYRRADSSWQRRVVQRSIGVRLRECVPHRENFPGHRILKMSFILQCNSIRT
jgi:hypothetical protein